MHGFHGDIPDRPFSNFKALNSGDRLALRNQCLATNFVLNGSAGFSYSMGRGNELGRVSLHSDPASIFKKSLRVYVSLSVCKSVLTVKKSKWVCIKFLDCIYQDVRNPTRFLSTNPMCFFFWLSTYFSSILLHDILSNRPFTIMEHHNPTY